MIPVARALTSVALLMIYVFALASGLDQSNVGHAVAIVMLFGALVTVWLVPEPPTRIG